MKYVILSEFFFAICASTSHKVHNVILSSSFFSLRIKTCVELYFAYKYKCELRFFLPNITQTLYNHSHEKVDALYSPCQYKTLQGQYTWGKKLLINLFSIYSGRKSVFLSFRGVLLFILGSLYLLFFTLNLWVCNSLPFLVCTADPELTSILNGCICILVENFHLNNSKSQDKAWTWNPLRMSQR